MPWCVLMGEGMFAHWQRLARHKIKTAKTTVRKRIYILSVCLYVVERQWLFACSKLSAMDGVACLLLLSIKKVKQNWIKAVAVAALANGSAPFPSCVGGVDDRLCTFCLLLTAISQRQFCLTITL